MSSLKKYTLFFFLSMSALAPAAASEFDHYLQQHQILDQQFKIINVKKLNELLTVLSAEDSRTLPIQIDQNTRIDQLQLSAHATQLKGMITTPDFAQFEKARGKKEVQQLLQKNLTQNCDILFEHQYQRVNPYQVQLSLRSDTSEYQLKLAAKDCAL